MKVLFVYPAKLGHELPLGLLYIASALKRKGHSLSFFSSPNYLYLLQQTIFFKYQLLRKVSSFKPDMVCFTVHSNQYHFIIELAKIIKQNLHVKIVVGGPHVTFMSDELDYDVIDYACCGEGDEAIVELADCIQNHIAPERILNICGVYNGDFVKNPVRNLLSDLDSLPFPERSLINPEHFLKYGTNVVSGFGCPFSCTYCIAKPISDYYRSKGTYTRYRSIENVIEELSELKARYKIPNVFFSDQTFTLKKKRLLEFLELYKSKINLPFHCQTRVDTVDRELFVAMKEAGCDFISLGIEAGNKDIRINVLKRNQSDEQIIEAFRLAKEVGITTSAFNMVGIPGETIDTIKDGVSLNRLVQPDRVHCNVFMAFPGTHLYDVCREKGYITGVLQGDYSMEAHINLPTLTKNELIAYKTTFEFGVKASERLYQWKPKIDLFISIIFKIVGIRRYLSVPTYILLHQFLRAIWKIEKSLRRK